jgi:hypothetical protein
MKYLLALLITFPVFACQISIPLSYVPTFLNPPVSGHYKKCEEAPEEECLCADVNPYTAVLADEMDEAGIYTGRKILIEDGAKKAAHEAAQAAKAQAEAQKAQAKALACQNLENSNIDSANTIASLKAIVKLMRECK